MKHPSRGDDAIPEIAIALPDAMRERLRRSRDGGPARPADPRLQQVQAIVEALKGEPGALLPVLHAVQDALGCVSSEAVSEIAEGLNLSRAEVHGVVTYYHHFRSQPAGRHVVQICRAEACQSMGAEQLWAHACTHLGLPEGGTARDGSVTLEPIYCLGLCASSPAMLLDEKLHARLTPARFDALLAAAREAAAGAVAASEATA